MASFAGTSDLPAAEAFARLQDPALVASILATAVDVTIVMTGEGVICEKVIANSALPPELFIGWPGKALAETVTNESRSKVEKLLSEAGNGRPHWRQVNHPVPGGADIPISYSAVRAGPEGHIIAMGRDMSTLSQLQQRLLAAEQAVEQEYQRLRSSETRFRVLLQSATDAILIVDARSGRVAECNPAFATLVGKPLKRIENAQVEDLFEADDWTAVKGALEALRNVGRSDDVVLRPSQARQQAILSATMFRQDSNTYYLLRIVPHTIGTSAVILPKAQSKVVKIISEMPDGFVVTEPDMKILTANAAFLEMAQLASEEQARGVPLETWLGHRSADAGQLLAQLKEKGEIRNFQTVVRGQFGTVEDVEVSAVAVMDSETPCLGFSFHHYSRSAITTTSSSRKSEQSLLRSVDEFTRLVGKVPLKELVRESTDIIERLCIEAALQLNGDNRAGAAEMLGLSRQSLYIKLHRYGIQDTAEDAT